MTSWKSYFRSSLILLALQIDGTGAHAEGEHAPGPYKPAPADAVAVTVAGDTDLSGTFAINNAGEIAIPLVGLDAVGDVAITGSQQAIEAVHKLIEDERSYIGIESRELSAQIAALDAQRPQVTTEAASLDGQSEAETSQVTLLKTRLQQNLSNIARTKTAP